MASETTLLPVLSPPQVRNSTSAKTPGLLDLSQLEASCSTAASDLSSQPGDCTDSEHDSSLSPREVCSDDVQWLLSGLTENQKTYLDRSAFHRECLRIFKNNDRDDSGFLDTQELQQVFEHLIPDSHRNLANASGRRLVLSIRSVIATFDRDSDRQLSAEEFCDFVRFCYAWRCHYETMTMDTKSKSLGDLQAGDSCMEAGPRNAASSSPLQSPPTPSGSGYRMVKSLSMGTSGFLDKSTSVPASPRSNISAQTNVIGPAPNSKSSKRKISSLARVQLKPLPSTSSSRQKLSSLVSPKGNSRASSRTVSPEPQASGRRTKSGASSRRVSPIPLASRSRRPRSASSSRIVAKAENVTNTSLAASASEPNLPLASSEAARGLVLTQSMSRPSSPRGLASLMIESGSSVASESHSRASPRTPRTGSRAGHKAARQEGLPRRQLQALKALVRELAPSHTSLHDLVSKLLLKVLSPSGLAAVPPEKQQHICDVVLRRVEIPSSPEVAGSTLSSSPWLVDFFELMHHSAVPLPANKSLEELFGESWFLEDRVVEVMTMLSVQWHDMRCAECVPEMTRYAQRRWLPPAFSSLVGQVLWRHRAAASLKRFEADVENVRWVTSLLDERIVDDFNRVFKHFANSNAGIMKLSAFRRVVELLAMNSDLRVRLRRCDAVRACYSDIGGRGGEGMNKKEFKLTLFKTAELMGVHPATLFEELAFRVDELEPSRPASRCLI
mmetsp:Transcript_48424/g.85322  ORF Transcript_48424/g.85322 Transcript_48424/m.85322 type:complete len:727 (+) Transcript_48424:66-2246(+)